MGSEWQLLVDTSCIVLLSGQCTRTDGQANISNFNVHTAQRMSNSYHRNPMYAAISVAHCPKYVLHFTACDNVANNVNAFLSTYAAALCNV